LLPLDAARLAEVEAAGELAHHHQIRRPAHLGPQRRGLRQGRVAAYRPQVGEQVHVPPQAEEARLPAHVGGYRLVARAAHGAEQHGVGGEHLFALVRRQQRTVGAEGRHAEGHLAHRAAEAAMVVEPGNDAQGLARHLGTDPVTGQGDELETVLAHGRAPSSHSSETGFISYDGRRRAAVVVTGRAPLENFAGPRARTEP
jgi:hypothetical protein